MLKAIPGRWFQRADYTVMDGEQPIATIEIAWSRRERGLLTVQGKDYDVYREGLWSGAYILKAAGKVQARAEKTSAFSRSYIIEHAGRQYTFGATSAFSARKFLLLEGDREIGAISPDGIFNRRARVDLPEEFPLPVRVFIIWLAVILWKREANVGQSH